MPHPYDPARMGWGEANRFALDTLRQLLIERRREVLQLELVLGRLREGPPEQPEPAPMPATPTPTRTQARTQPRKSDPTGQQALREDLQGQVDTGVVGGE